jgi:calcineurin-like phosphoesterase family protein
MGQIFYTSDTHYGHARLLLEYCPGRLKHWSTVEDMNEGLIARWNDRVGPEDTVYHLGDFAMGRAEDAQPIFERLNGAKKILILGNHDRSAKFMRAMGWTDVAKAATIKAPDGRVIHLAHHPQSYERLDQMRVELQLCGHIHEKWARGAAMVRTSMIPPYRDYVGHWGSPTGRIFNVGVDVRNFQPVTLAELLGA